MTEKLGFENKLDKTLILSLLDDNVVGRLSALQVLESISSTNDRVLKQVGWREGGFVVCVANHQTQGKGRNGKAWQSPSDANIYMSLGGVFDVSLIKGINGLSLACGVVVARFLESMGIKSELKWPNDILIKGKKLAGILVESRVQAGQVILVVGIGLNVKMPVIGVNKIDQPWTDLNSVLTESNSNLKSKYVEASHESEVQSKKKQLDRNYLVAQLINAFTDCLMGFSESGFGSYADDWMKYELLTGCDVVIKTDKEEFNAKVTGYNKDYALKVEIENEEKIFYAADIKLKLNSYANN